MEGTTFNISPLASILDTPKIEVPLVGCILEDLTSGFIGTKKSRLGAAPDHSIIRSTIERYKSQGTPIRILSMWGGLKGYGLDSDRPSADLLDAMALRRIDSFRRFAAERYSPGIRWTILFEDLTKTILDTHAKESDINEYLESLQHMVDIFGLWREVEIVRESTLLKTDRNEYIKQVHVNRAAFARYFEDPSRFEEVKALGWTGQVPPEMWNYYMERSKARLGDDFYARKYASTLYFGNTLARVQAGVALPPDTDAHGAIPLLKGSFAAYPPGVAEGLLANRVEFKVKDTKNDHSCPPWAGFGMIHQGSFTEVPIRAIRSARFERQDAIASSDRGTMTFRSDALI